MDKRKTLHDILEQFCKGSMTADIMNYKIVALLKEGGISDALSAAERRTLNNFMAWYSDVYEEGKQPRPGFMGYMKDTWDQIIHGEYRVTLERVKEKAKELADMLASKE